MTCIVGYGNGSRVIIGGDSAGVSGYDLTTRADEKVFTVEGIAFGFTSSFRMGQLLRYKLKPPPHHPSTMTDHEYLATVFVDEVRQVLKDGGFTKTNSGVEQGGTFLLGYRGLIYKVESDFQVGRSTDFFDACGCGESFAIGAMHALNGDPKFPPKAMLETALRIAERNSTGVRGPFVFVEVERE